MKKIIGICLLSSACALFASPFAKYQEYAKKPSPEAFTSAYVHYLPQAVDSTNVTEKLMITYLHASELNRTLEQLQSNPDLTPPQMFQIANLLLELNRPEEAVKLYDKINSEMQDWSCPWRHKGEAFLKMNELEKSEKALLKAIETREDHFDAYTMLAEVQFKLGKKKDALKTIQKAFTINDSEEDHEKEVSMFDVYKLRLDILKANKKKKDWNRAYKEMKQKFPNEESINSLKY